MTSFSMAFIKFSINSKAISWFCVGKVILSFLTFSQLHIFEYENFWIAICNDCHKLKRNCNPFSNTFLTFYDICLKSLAKIFSDYHAKKRKSND